DSSSREIRFGGKKVLGLSNMISNIKFEVNDTYILMTIETNKIKDKQGKNMTYTVPLLTILTQSS
ncbi:MAG TPA: hypothetical protein PLD16_07245, partial [Fervidobacterium sp.]|nr:hypothetical protein [Fervidobacterium sp.]